jgi:hypothetical protein
MPLLAVADEEILASDPKYELKTDSQDLQGMHGTPESGNRQLEAGIQRY